MIISFSWV